MFTKRAAFRQAATQCGVLLLLHTHWRAGCELGASPLQLAQHATTACPDKPGRGSFDPLFPWCSVNPQEQPSGLTCAACKVVRPDALPPHRLLHPLDVGMYHAVDVGKQRAHVVCRCPHLQSN